MSPSTGKRGRSFVAAMAAAVIVLSASSRRAAAFEPQAATPDATHPAAVLDGGLLDVGPTLTIYARGSAQAASIPRLERFFAAHSPDWEVRWDQRNDRPHLIQGAGVPLLPAGTARDVRLDEVEPLVRDFLARFPELLGVDLATLRLDHERTVSFDHGRTWFLELQQTERGVPVAGANVFVRIKHGNVVQFGADRVADVGIAIAPAVSADEAFASGLAQAGLAGAQVTRAAHDGQLRLYPTLTPGELPAQPYSGIPGQGYAHVLAWEFVFTRGGDPASYRLLVDARDGRALRLEDMNRYASATVQGGIYPVTNTDPEEVRPFPFANVANGGTKVTDANGVYDYTGGTATVTLDGKYTRIVDQCGPLSLSNNTNGNLNLASGPGTNCTTPGVGGPGNTHAARSGFYHLTKINRKAATYLPNNSWLAGALTANMNIDDTCNAFWSPTTGAVNFYRAGPDPYGQQCSNTGEIAGVFLHEWGHGMDQNAGGVGDPGSGEAVGDTFAFLQTKDGCIGPNFTPGHNCHNCGACTGVRNVEAFAQAGPAVIARPNNVLSDQGTDCDRWECPYITPQNGLYAGPMGYEAHCESYIASTANWDLADALVKTYGDTNGWAAMDSLWYESLISTKDAYRVAGGGLCNPGATVNGCGATNWYSVFLVADDDDGNLANGTPNGCRIWDAFDAHGIACGARPACTGGGEPGGEAPTNLTAVAQVDLGGHPLDAIELAWDDNSDEEWGFEVWERSDNGGWDHAWTAAENDPQATIWVQQPASGSVTYRYKVRAFYGDILTDFSNEASATVYAQPPTASATITPSGCVNSATPQFTWTPADRALTYYVAAIRVDNGELVMDAPSVSGTSYVPGDPLPTGVPLLWKVKACNNAGCGPWSPYQPFTSYCTPTEPPILLTPQGCVNNTLRPTLSWTSVPGATDYIWSLWQVDPASPNDDVVLYNSVHTPNTSATVPQDLQSGTQYRFRVKTGNGPNYGPFSHHRYFTIGCTAGMKPGTASPLSPWNGELTSALPTLSWEAATLADSYAVEVYTYPANQFVYAVAYAASAVCNAFDCAATPSTPLLAGQGYAWHVRAQNTAGFGPFSPWATFAVPTVNNAAFVSQTVPDAMTTGQFTPVTVRMRNTGTTTWTSGAGYALADPAGNVWGIASVPLPANVPPGGEVTFAFALVPPAPPGHRAFQWRMLQNSVGWFGEPSASVNIMVSHPIGPNESAGHDIFQESVTGTVWLEAEQFSRNLPRNGYRWELDHTPDHAGIAAMRAAPNSGGGFGAAGYSTTSPQLDFKVNFTHTGTHYVWVRGYAPSPDPPSNDSCHIGLDGAEVATSDRISGFGSGWTWSDATMDGLVATVIVTTPGVHTVNLWMREDGFVVDQIMLTTDAGLVPTGHGRVSGRGAVQQEAGPFGLAVFELERYDTRVARSDHDWVPEFTAGSGGIAAMQAAPNVNAGIGGNWSTLSPELDVKVNFVETGTHYVWVRGYAPGPSVIDDDSCHVGIDGQELESGKALAFFQDGWTWSNTLLFTQARATIDVTTPGVHTFNLWMREDGFIADRVVITKSASYKPFAADGLTVAEP